ncbi:MAG: ribulose-phosphate 3-epimerase [Candidatus Omnitrophota bacterium]
MKIIPAILTDDPEDFRNKLSQAERVTDFAQIDIMDGRFVPSQSVGQDVLSKIKSPIGLEFHLMVDAPQDYLAAARSSCVKRVIFHYEACAPGQGANRPAPRQIIEAIRALGMQAGLAINPQTPTEDVEALLGEIDLLLFLSVNPGYYGSPFIPAVLDKAKRLSGQRRNFLLGLDGGVKKENIRAIRDAGLDIAYVGSGIFKGGAPQDNYRELNKIIC